MRGDAPEGRVLYRLTVELAWTEGVRWGAQGWLGLAAGAWLTAGALRAGLRLARAWSLRQGALLTAPGYLRLSVAGAAPQAAAVVGLSALLVWGTGTAGALSGLGELSASGRLWALPGALTPSLGALWLAALSLPLAWAGRRGQWGGAARGAPRPLPGVLRGPDGQALRYALTAASVVGPAAGAAQVVVGLSALGRPDWADQPAWQSGSPQWVALRGWRAPPGQPQAPALGVARLRPPGPGLGWAPLAAEGLEARGAALVRLSRPLRPGESGAPGQVFIGVPGGRFVDEQGQRFEDLGVVLAAWGLVVPAVMGTLPRSSGGAR